MSLNSNVFIPLGLPVTQRAYLLGHSVETNERFYSHMKTESLVDLKDVLNIAGKTNAAPDVQKRLYTHTYTHQNREFWRNKKHRKAHKH